MSRVDIKVQTTLLKEAGAYFKNLQPVTANEEEKQKDDVVLTQEHIYAWLEVFYEDKIMMGTCNEASVRM
jgi:hypothetical protein